MAAPSADPKPVVLAAVIERIAGEPDGALTDRYELLEATPEQRALAATLQGHALLAALLTAGHRVELRPRALELAADSVTAKRVRAERARAQSEAGPRSELRPPRSQADAIAVARRILEYRPPRMAEALSVVLGLDARELTRLFSSGAWKWSTSRNEIVWAKRAPGPGEQWELTIPASKDKITDPKQAWEALTARSLIPASWTDNPGRTYARTINSSSSVEPMARPDTLRGVVAIAADPQRALQAETFARELVQRMQPWGWGPVDRFVWHQGAPTSYAASRSIERYPKSLARKLRSISEKASFRALDWFDGPYLRLSFLAGRGSVAGRDLSDDVAAWAQGIERNTRVGEKDSPLWSELADPFEPAFNIVGAGAFPEGRTRDGAYVLSYFPRDDGDASEGAR